MPSPIKILGGRHEASLRRAVEIIHLSAPTLIGTGVSFIASPLLSRLYTPAQFGEAGALLAAASILSLLFTWRAELLLFSEHASLIRNIFQATLQLVAATWIFGQVFVLTFAHLLSPDAAWAPFASAALATGGALALGSLGASAAVLGDRHFAAGMTRGITSLLYVFFAFSLAATAYRHGKLALALCNMAACVAALAWVAPTIARLVPKISSLLQYTLLLDFLRVHWQRLIYQGAAGAMNAAGFLNLYLLLSKHYYGPEATGALFMAYRIVALPSTLLTGAIGTQLVKQYGRSEIIPYKLLIAKLSAVSIFAYICTATAAMALWPLLGQGWAEAKAAVVPLCLLCACQFTVGSTVNLFTVRGGARSMFFWEGGRLLLTATIVSIGAQFGLTWTSNLLIYVASQAAAYVFLAILIGRSRLGRQQ